jgi:hypothetical protein
MSACASSLSDLVPEHPGMLLHEALEALEAPEAHVWSLRFKSTAKTACFGSYEHPRRTRTTQKCIQNSDKDISKSPFFVENRTLKPEKRRQGDKKAA